MHSPFSMKGACQLLVDTDGRELSHLFPRNSVAVQVVRLGQDGHLALGQDGHLALGQDGHLALGARRLWVGLLPLHWASCPSLTRTRQ